LERELTVEFVVFYGIGGGGGIVSPISSKIPLSAGDA